MALPLLLPVPEIHERLGTVFPEGTAHRNFLIREMAAKTVFTMLYVGAVHGTNCWLRPDQVTRMTDHQAASTGEEDRIAWFISEPNHIMVLRRGTDTARVKLADLMEQ